MKSSHIRTKTTLPKELDTKAYIIPKIIEFLSDGVELTSLELSAKIGVSRERLDGVITQMSNEYLLYEFDNEEGMRVYGRLCR